MADVGTVYEGLIAEWAIAFGVNVVKGKPTWARPDVTLPVAALEIMAWNPDLRQRVGQRQPLQQAVYRGWFFARNEPELVTLLTRLAAWAQAHPIVALAGERIQVAVQDVMRYEPQTPAQQEQHAFAWLTTTTFAS
jgi:hypothetical protein